MDKDCKENINKMDTHLKVGVYFLRGVRMRRKQLIEFNEIVCIGRYDDLAIFVDEENSLAYVRDPEEIIQSGSICMDEGVLNPLIALDVTKQKQIVSSVLCI